MDRTRFSVVWAAGMTMLCFFTAAGTARGQTVGVGIQLMSQDGEVVIVQVLEGGPAERAGLQAGDSIARIDGVSMHGVALADVVQRLTGSPGEEVRLGIVRTADSVPRLFDVRLTRQAIRPTVLPPRMAREFLRIVHPPAESAQVQWHNNHIVSRVLPYPDLPSLLIRLPIAHAAATGRGVRIAVIQRSQADHVASAIVQIAPDATANTFAPDGEQVVGQLTAKVIASGSMVAVIPDMDTWPREVIVKAAQDLLSSGRLVVIPADFSEDPNKIETVNMLHRMGALTVGCVNNWGRVVETTPAGTWPYNRQLRQIEVDVFSTVASEPFPDARAPVACTAGVAALVLQRWPALSAGAVRQKIIEGARQVWQSTSLETGRWVACSVDPITTEYKPSDEKAIYRFRLLDAAGALGVDTEVSWWLNMLDCPRAWEITRGKGVVVAVTDNGFHIRHPDLAAHIKGGMHFGSRGFDAADQQFHGTEMSRIVLAIAPEATIMPLLCGGQGDELAADVARSFEFAVGQKVDVISSSWSALLNRDLELPAAVRNAADQGVVVSWFHYPEPYAGVLRPYFVYGSWSKERRLGFSDRFLINPPTFHPVEIEAGLSNTAPQAAAIAALVRSVNAALKPAEIEKLIFDNSDPVGDTILIPSAFRAVQAARGQGAN